jgi:hypothetical protein
MTTALHPHEGVKLKTASGGSYQKPLKSFGDLTFKTQYSAGFAINLSANSPSVSCSTSEDPLGFFVSDNFYNFVENNSVNNTDPFGLAIFKNNCDRPIPYKPEETCGTCNKAKKYSCPPGATCDVDGVYPSDGGNPIKIVDGCEAECKDGKLKIICRSLKSLLGQRLIGGPKSDKWMDKHQDWPRPNDPVLPPCQK